MTQTLARKADIETIIFEAKSLSDFRRFPQDAATLGVLRRSAPAQADRFFQTLTQTPVRISGTVREAQAETDIRALTDDNVPPDLQADPFYTVWLSDMAHVCRSVCHMIRADRVQFHLDSRRTCRRYHVDNLSIRTVVSYYGIGTEYLLECGADRDAYRNGAANDQIVRDPSAIHYLDAWDVAVIRGGSEGLLHKTPDVALNQPSVFMRVDPPSDH